MLKYLIVISFLWIGQIISAQDLVFKDANFEKAVLEYEPAIDINGDGLIQQTEADSVTELRLMEKDIHLMDDAYLFPNLVELVLTNNSIKQVRVVGFKHLQSFSCAASEVAEAELRDLPELTEFALNFNLLDTLLLSNLPRLTSYSAQGNNLRAINVGAFPLLKYLTISDNKLSQLDVTGNPELIQIMAEKNNFIELDIRFNPKLKTNILYIDEKKVKIIGIKEQQKLIEQEGLGPRIYIKN